MTEPVPVGLDEKLKPCPFCGGEAELRRSEIPREFATRIRCKAGCVEVTKYSAWQVIDADTRALTAWNTRASPEPIAVNAGMVLVPREPTEAMVAAAYKDQPDAINAGFSQAYRAMIAASPKENTQP